jgi:hypothetical protein
MKISFAGEGQIIDMLKERGWAYQARPDPPKHQEITFMSDVPTLLFAGGEEKRAVTFLYDRDLYFTKGAVSLFISQIMDRVAFYTGRLDPQRVVSINAFFNPSLTQSDGLPDISLKYASTGQEFPDLPMEATISFNTIDDYTVKQCSL